MVPVPIITTIVILKLDVLTGNPGFLLQGNHEKQFTSLQGM